MIVINQKIFFKKKLNYSFFPKYFLTFRRINMSKVCEKDLLRLEKLKEENRNGTTFNELVLENHQKIYSLFRRMVQTHDEADDLTQETFIKVYKNFSKFKFQSSPYTWIYRIAVNTGINYLRGKKVKQFFGLEKVKNLPSSDNPAVSDERNTVLRQAVAKLSPKQQMVVLLRSFQELPFKQIAIITGSTENTVKVNFSHALKSLKRIIRNMGVNYETL